MSLLGFCVAQGAQVIASCRQTESANQLHLLKKKYGKKLTIIPLDVTQENSIKEAFNLALEEFLSSRSSGQ